MVDTTSLAGILAASKATPKTAALTQAEIDAKTAAVVAAGGKSTDPANRLPGETAAQANARITAAYKAQPAPELTKEGKAAGATMEFVRTGAGGVGVYKEVYPIGVPIPQVRTTVSGTQVDVSGTSTGATTTKPTTTVASTSTTATTVQSNPIIAAGGSPGGKDSTGKEIFYKLESTGAGMASGSNVGFYYADGTKVPINNLVGNREVLSFTNAGWSVQGLPKGVTPGAVKYADILKDAEARGQVVGSDAYMIGDVVVTRDFNGVSLYNNQGQLISGKGSQYQVGIAGNSATGMAQINIAAVGAFGTPEYDVNLALKGSTGAPITGTLTTTTATTTKPTTTTATTTMATTSTATTSTAGLTTTQYNERMGVYSAMADRFNKYGLTGLANKIKELAIQGATEATITLQLQETPEYQQRFAANADRIKKGLSVLTPAEYVNVEDSYRQVLRAYGLKQFDNDAYVRQFIANDMSPTELSNRVVTAVQRVQNADPALVNQLKQYYGIGAQDMVAYVLDPEQQFQKIERQIAASEIGVAAGRQGLTAGVSVAEQLAAQGVSEAEARKGYATIADILPTAEKLSDIYGTTLDGYRQSEGEQEVFNSLASAQRKRQKLTQREIAAFSGSSGTNKTSLTTSNVGQF